MDFEHAKHRSVRRAKSLTTGLSLLLLTTLTPFDVFTARAQIGGSTHWIETSATNPSSLLVRPADPDAEGMSPGEEVCELPLGQRIALSEAPAVDPQHPHYLSVKLEEPSANCGLTEGWVYRASLAGNSREPPRTSEFKLRVTQSAVLTADGASPQESGSACTLPSDSLQFLEEPPRWKEDDPGKLEVTLVQPLIDCPLTMGWIDVNSVNLAESTAPERLFDGASSEKEVLHWVVTGDEKVTLRTKHDVPASELEPRTGKCVLMPNTRYALTQPPGYHDRQTFHIDLARKPKDCAFTFGYVSRKLLAQVSSAGGVPLTESTDLQGVGNGFWIQMGERSPYLRIRTDVPMNELEAETGKCVLNAGQRYWLSRAPGNNNESTIQVLFKEPIAGCRFTYGYITRELVVASSPLSGTPPVNSRDSILSRVASAAASMQDKDVFSLGCPRSYRRGTGSVCCARLVSMALGRADVDFKASDAVTALIANLKAKGWKQVPASQGPVGAVIFHDKTPGSHGSQHIGICAERGCAKAWNSWQQRFALNFYPTLPEYARFVARGGNWGGALVPP